MDTDTSTDMESDESVSDATVSEMDVDESEFEPENNRFEFDRSIHENMINHVFLPRQLPQSESTELYREEIALLALMVDTLESIDESLPKSTLRLFRSFYRIHCESSVDATILFTEINTLEPGDMTAMYIRHQNCGLIMTRPKLRNKPAASSNKVIISTFPASQSNQHVYNCSGDIQVEYPTQSIKCDYSKIFKSIEFAEQLSNLCDRTLSKSMPKPIMSGYEAIETRDVPSTKYVAKWLLAAISTRNTVAATPKDFPVISKKFRDEIWWQKASFPFRRSSLWTVIKAVLQLNLTHELGELYGKLYYKVIMIKFMATMCKMFDERAYRTFDNDLVMQTLAKTARRMDKLSKHISDDPELSVTLRSSKKVREPLQDLFVIVAEQATQIIAMVHKKIENRFKALEAREQKNSMLTPLVDIDFISGVKQQVTKLKQHLQDHFLGFTPNSMDVAPKPKLFYRHRIENASLPSVDIFNKISSEIDVNIFLTDVENWILFVLMDNDNRFTSDDLRSLAMTYATKAESIYGGDPFGSSKMVLILLKIVAVLDYIATHCHPLLLEHHSGINPKIIDNLLLPQRTEMEIALHLQHYFKLRNRTATYPALIGEEEITKRSFSARFAESNDEMQNVKSEILKMAAKRKEEKRVQWRKTRTEINQMKNDAASMTCEYNINKHGRRSHSSKCALCKLNKNIESIRLEVYQLPLPLIEYKRNAIVFELLMPMDVACLRDVLYEVVKRCNETTTEFKIFCRWINYNQISKYAKNSQARVFLGSSTKLTLKGHIARQHPDNAFESFVVENGYNCNLYADKKHLPTTVQSQSVQKFCTFKVENASVYENLQWTLEKTDHWQNSVMAKQNLCPQELRLSEYINFGSLRADGHRLQLRNLYRMIETDALSFETPSVLSLVMQTLWEAGPNHLQEWYRESHQDFTDLIFVDAFTELLVKYISQQESNWKHPLKFLMSVLVAVRMFEINSDETTANRVVNLLLRLRAIAIKWIRQIEAAVGSCSSKEDVEKLRMNLVKVTMAGALTFFVHYRHQYIDKVFKNNVDHSSLSAWLHFIVTLNNNILLNDMQLNPTDQNQKIFLRIVRNVGVHLQAKFSSLIGTNAKELKDFVKAQWPEARTGAFGHFQRSSISPQIVLVDVLIRDVVYYVQIDVITGQFLVNDLPVARLPPSIAQSLMFRRVFENFVFEVQPSTQSFSTLYQYNGCNYIFQLYNNNVIITERRENGEEHELIPHELLMDEIPFLLVVNYSHWWNKTKHTIEFRPKSFRNKHFSTPAEVQYELDLDNGLLKHIKTNRCMLDVASKSFVNITKFLSRLESKNYIHVLMDKPQIAKVELVRMKLKFIIDASQGASECEVLSNEFTGMRVSLNQQFGTLIGLNNGLLLESFPDRNNSSERLLILPHGQVTVQRKERHISVGVAIDNEELRTPSFFTYQVDDLCRYLKASNGSYSAWFYLAYLHAVTSHPIPDPFTGLTGTERSLQILQSGYSWSSAPYDTESFTTLTNIAKLSPVRQFYPDHLKVMQIVHWPEGINEYAAQDTFIFVVQKLLDDSRRLSGLHFEEEENKFEYKTNLMLNQRDYFRCLPLYPNCCVSNTFMPHEHSTDARHSHIIDAEIDLYVDNTRIISTFFDENVFHVPSASIYNFIVYDENLARLNGLCHNEIVNVMDFCVHKSLANLWISLYEIARKLQLSKREEFMFALTLLAYEGNNLEQLLILQAIAANKDEFIGINPPAVDIFIDPSEHKFQRDKIVEIIRLTQSRPNDFDERPLDYIRRYVAAESAQLNKLTDSVQSMWPCDFVNISIIDRIEHDKFEINVEAIGSINTLLRKWNNNRKLKTFIRQVEAQVRLLSPIRATQLYRPAPWRKTVVGTKHFPKYQIEFDEKMCENWMFNADKVTEASNIFQNSADDTEACQRFAADYWWNLFKAVSTPARVQYLIESGLYPRLVPSLVLPKLLSNTTNQMQKAIVGAFAIQTTREQRSRRITKLESQPQMAVALQRERDNTPHENWKPHEYPEWLLFEIEMDLSIRRIQVEVAKRMIDPPEISTKHSVMQLNMGEGKTAVIVPILAAVLANGEQLCQVTVLKTLIATNQKSLRQCLGGMLNRRIYIFPCRRDMRIEEYIDEILPIYEECKQEKGVVITLPEYRLSFQLKMYEAANKGNIDNARSLLNAHKWLNSNTRNILDESDAILHAKYQLTYTIGEQMALDGGAVRWTTVQAVLKRVPYQMKILWEKYGNEKIEFDNDYVRNGHVYGHSKNVNYRTDVFTPCRILDASTYAELKTALVEDFMNGNINITFPETAKSTKTSLRVLLDEKNLSKKLFDEHIQLFPVNVQSIILILAGLLKFEVMRLVMTKRWRVNYGVNQSGTRKMAIPFKAKDVAAEMTEFGHPDVAICFTHLSYYYSGLTDEQLYQVFDTLALTENPQEIYEQWIRSMSKALVDISISSYTGVNLSDPKQREEILFPVFRYNMHVIDYWLSHFVFPREAKTFERKMMCTAWDLCSEHINRTVSGFSGTNDTKNVLPMPISQNDLDELEQTNENVRKTLLREENEAYKCLPANVSGLSILLQLVEREIPVLLDSGALMLELNNEQVAREWLKLAPSESFDAAVYFNDKDILMTIDRNDFIVEFDYSVYREKLDRCVIYLDDAHTRGTDLKFPTGSRACVTLSGEITRDKTVQACMRMRMLGQGHTISFWASFEADIRIRNLCKLSQNKSVSTANIIDFICQNSREFEKENIVHWAFVGYNYTKKLSAHKLYENSDSVESIQCLCKQCTDDEYVSLHELYGGKENALLTQIITNKFLHLANYSGNTPITQSFINTIYVGVLAKLEQQIPNFMQYTQILDEEQEKELEYELEEQRQIERPPPAPPAAPFFNPLFKKLFKHGVKHNSFNYLHTNGAIFALPKSFINTKLYELIGKELSAWGKNLFASKDFTRVINVSAGHKSDEYLRPVWWIARIKANNAHETDVLIVLSSFECNELLPVFKSSKCSILHMFCPRLSQFHSHLMHDERLQITAMTNAGKITVDDEVQIEIFSGSMYFQRDEEQDAYCNFMGLIPRPRSIDQQQAFEDGIIEQNGFVPPGYRSRFPSLINNCMFTRNPAKIADEIIQRRHQFMRKESHVASIIEKGKKALLDEQV